MVFGHDFMVTRKVTYHVKEYTCKNCNKQLTTNGNGQLIELSPKFREINDVLERIHEKRVSKINKQIFEQELLVFKH
jgi:hypothetical protein